MSDLVVYGTSYPIFRFTEGGSNRSISLPDPALYVLEYQDEDQYQKAIDLTILTLKRGWRVSITFIFKLLDAAQVRTIIDLVNGVRAAGKCTIQPHQDSGLEFFNMMYKGDFGVGFSEKMFIGHDVELPFLASALIPEIPGESEIPVLVIKRKTFVI